MQHCDKRKVFSFVLNDDEVEQRRRSFGSEFQRREGLKQGFAYEVVCSVLDEFQSLVLAVMWRI